jgi:hypothetical protein
VVEVQETVAHRHAGGIGELERHRQARARLAGTAQRERLRGGVRGDQLAKLRARVNRHVGRIHEHRRDVRLLRLERRLAFSRAPSPRASPGPGGGVNWMKSSVFLGGGACVVPRQSAASIRI